MRRTLMYGSLLLLFITFASFSYIALKIPLKETGGALVSLKKRYLLLSFLLLFLYHTFDNLRLYVLSRAVKVRYSFLYGYLMSLVNTFGATVTPAHVGGELTAVYMLLRKGISAHKVMSVVTMKTISGLSFFVLAFPLFIWELGKNPGTILPVLEIFFVISFLFGGAYFLFSKRPSVVGFWGKLKRYGIYLKIYGYKRKRYVAASVLSSVALYTCFLLIAPALLMAFGGGEDWGEVLFSQLGLLYAIFVSPTPGGSGVGELGGIVAFSPFLGPAEVGVFVILWRLVSQYISALIGGILFAVLIVRDMRV